MVMKADSNYFIALLAANRNTDKNKLKKIINDWIKKLPEDSEWLKVYKKPVKKVDFAKEAWMKKNIIGKIGATPPFGSLMKLLVIMDGPLFNAADLIVNAGEYTESIKLKSKDFVKIEEPVKGNFSVKK